MERDKVEETKQTTHQITGKPTANPEDIERHIRALFSTVTDRHYVALFALPSRTHRFPTCNDKGVEYAVKWAKSLADTEDLYVGAYLVDAVKSPSTRGTMADVRAIVGLYCDIDVAQPGDKTANHLPDFETAWALIGRAEKAFGGSSLVVESGHGLQPWWLFDGALPVSNVDERKYATNLLRQFVAWFQREAKPYHIDHCKDLVRVLRLAGTVNHKGSVKTQTAIGFYDPSVHADIDRITDAVQDIIPVQSQRESPVSDGELAGVEDLVVDENADPPAKFHALLENIEEAKAIWDGKKKYASDSERDMALANYAASAAWSAQEVLNLILALRRETGSKAKHRGYYLATVTKAMGSSIGEKARRQIAGEEAEDPDGDPDPFAAALGVPVVQKLRYGREEPRYSIVIRDAAREAVEISLGSAQDMLNTTTLRATLMNATGALPFMTWKRSEIEGWVNQLVSTATLMDTDASAAADTEEWLRDYLAAEQNFIERHAESGTSALDGVDYRNYQALMGQRLTNDAPYVDEDGRAVVSVSAMVAWMAKRGRDVDPGDLRSRLRRGGWEPLKVQGRVEGTHHQRRAWRSPAGWVEA